MCNSIKVQNGPEGAAITDNILSVCLSECFVCMYTCMPEEALEAYMVAGN